MARGRLEEEPAVSKPGQHAPTTRPDESSVDSSSSQVTKSSDKPNNAVDTAESVPDEDNEVVPIPITSEGDGTHVAFLRWRGNATEQPVWLKPIPGLEYLHIVTKPPWEAPQRPIPGPEKRKELIAELNLGTPDQSVRATYLCNNTSRHGSLQSQIQTVPSRQVATQGPRKRKRTPSKPTVRSKLVEVREEEDEDDDDEEEGPSVTMNNVITHRFYIGDIDELKAFYTVRLKELTMKPLRPIVTDWVKKLEPNRSREYGKYHRQFPCQRPAHMTPPWWPSNVPYSEPAHLQMDHLIPLAIDLLLINREKDEIKRQVSWTNKLKTMAFYHVSQTSLANYSNSASTEYSETMRQRALREILPDLFDAAQHHEDHIMQYELYEGNGNNDPGTGRYHTWTRATKPPKAPKLPIKKLKKRRKNLLDTATSRRRSRAALDEDSGDETEPDEQTVALTNQDGSPLTSFQSTMSLDDVDVKKPISTPSETRPAGTPVSQSHTMPSGPSLSIASTSSLIHQPMDGTLLRPTSGYGSQAGNVTSPYQLPNHMRPIYDAYGPQPMDGITNGYAQQPAFDPMLEQYYGESMEQQMLSNPPGTSDINTYHVSNAPDLALRHMAFNPPGYFQGLTPPGTLGAEPPDSSMRPPGAGLHYHGLP